MKENFQIGYSPIGFVRCGRSACRIAKMNWKIGKETGGKKMEDPHSLKSNEMAEVPVGVLVFFNHFKVDNRRFMKFGGILVSSRRM